MQATLQQYLLEEGYNFSSKFLCCTETLRVQHDLSNQLSVWFGHGKAAEQLL